MEGGRATPKLLEIPFQPKDGVFDLNMQATEYIWHNGKFVPWANAQVHVLTHTLHYGGGTFEGIRVYKTDRGPAIFRLDDHIERLFYSADALQMKCPYTQSDISKAIVELVRKNRLEAGYVRPLVYYGYGKMGVAPVGAPVEVALACWPWGAYLPPGGVDIKTSKYIRIHPQSSVADAKIVGHYVNGILAGFEIHGTKYHEALLLDYKGNIAEGPGENFFIVKNGMISTPPLGTILKGITRKTIMELAPLLGFKVEEKDLTLGEAYGADEAFFTGTAAEVTPIRSIDDQPIGGGAAVGPITAKLRDAFDAIVHGRDPAHDHLLTYVNLASPKAGNG